MTTPYENGYQLGLRHAGELTAREGLESWREYEEVRDLLAAAPGTTERVLALFQDGYMRGRYAMAARKVGGGYTPW